MSDNRDRMEIDDVLDTILQKNMKELHQDDEPEEVPVTTRNERMMVERAKEKASVEEAFTSPEAEEMFPEDGPKEKDPYDSELYEVEERIIEEAAAEIEEDQTNHKDKKDMMEEKAAETVLDSHTENEDNSEDVRVIEVSVGDDEDKRFTQKDLVAMLMYVGVILVMTFLIVHYVGQRTRVSGSSMEATLSDGDNLIVDKLSYRFVDPERFDIVIFPYQYEDNTYYIKRIIGLPGETVQIDFDGNIYINGEILQEHYGKETIIEPGRAKDPIKLGEDEYFVLGDNRNNSSDSRFDGVANVNEDIIIGRAFLRIYPFNKITFLKDK